MWLKIKNILEQSVPKLSFLFIILNALDVITTFIGLKTGMIKEVGVITNYFINNNMVLQYFALKILLPAFILALGNKFNFCRVWQMGLILLIANIFYIMVVSNNLLIMLSI